MYPLFLTKITFNWDGIYKSVGPTSEIFDDVYYKLGTRNNIKGILDEDYEKLHFQERIVGSKIEYSSNLKIDEFTYFHHKYFIDNDDIDGNFKLKMFYDEIFQSDSEVKKVFGNPFKSIQIKIYESKLFNL